MLRYFVLNAADFEMNVSGLIRSWRTCLRSVEVYENAWPTVYFAPDLKDSSFGSGILKGQQASYKQCFIY